MSAQDMSLLSTNLSGWAKLAQLSSQRWTHLEFLISNLKNDVSIWPVTAVLWELVWTKGIYFP